jgi:predicted metal-dependent phosphoesterase TrpH
MGRREKSRAPMSLIRAVLHAHSTWSYDGSWTLDQIARFYGRLGVDVVMMSEHDTGFAPGQFQAYRDACAEASTSACRLVPGIEYSSPNNDIHLPTWGLDQFLGEHRPTLDILQDVHAAGGVSIFAHPIRRDVWQQYDPAWTPLLSAIEVWNRKSDGISYGSQALALRIRTGLPATVGQDFHKLRHAYPLTHLFEVDPNDNLEVQLVEAIRCGQLRPQAYRRDLFTAEGQIKSGLHPHLERARCFVRDTVRRTKK